MKCLFEANYFMVSLPWIAQAQGSALISTQWAVISEILSVCSWRGLLLLAVEVQPYHRGAAYWESIAGVVPVSLSPGTSAWKSSQEVPGL